MLITIKVAHILLVMLNLLLLVYLKCFNKKAECKYNFKSQLHGWARITVDGMFVIELLYLFAAWIWLNNNYATDITSIRFTDAVYIIASFVKSIYFLIITSYMIKSTKIIIGKIIATERKKHANGC